MNAEWKEEGLVVPSSSFDEQALPHRTVSFAPKPQIRQPNIAEREPTNFSIRHPSASFSVDLPRVLQAGIRPDTIACRGVRQGQSKATPRQLALGGEGVLGTDRHERDMHFGVPLIQGEEAHTHLKRLDEKMEKIATGGKWNNLCVPSQATLGYVATMRRQQFANAYISFRHPQRGLSRNAGELRQPLTSHVMRL